MEKKMEGKEGKKERDGRKRERRITNSRKRKGRWMEGGEKEMKRRKRGGLQNRE